MSMQAMVHEMRDRFLVALVFTIPIVVWSPVGETLQTMPLGTANASARPRLRRVSRAATEGAAAPLPGKREGAA
jgi:hypothetical protein